MFVQCPYPRENADAMTLDKTVPRAEKKITVVATRIIMFELSFIASRSGILLVISVKDKLCYLQIIIRI